MSEPEAEKPKSDLRKLMNRDVSKLVRFIFFGGIVLVVLMVLAPILLSWLSVRATNKKQQLGPPVSDQR
ncbi:hypothetical protein MCEMSE15_01077 [Fimbriimonadaceae bacterium]